MRRSFWASTAGSALLFAGAIACSDTTAPGGSSAFETQVDADLAPTAGEEVATDYAFYASASGTGIGASFSQNVGTGVSASIAPPTAAAAWINPSCAANGPNHMFRCPKFPWFGHSLDVSFTFYDANGVTQTAYDNITTASINFTVNDTGATAFSSNHNSFADTSAHHRDVTLSNLAGNPDTVHIWNGTGSTTLYSVRQGQITKVYHMSSSDTTTDVYIRQPRGLNPYPLSGTIIRNYAVTRTRSASDTVTRSTSRRVVVTFNGTANVPMLVGPDQYMLNLDTHSVVKQ